MVYFVWILDFLVYKKIKGKTMKLRLKEIRIKNGLTKREVANIIGITTVKYFLYENKILKMHANELIIFCQHFNISSNYLLGLSDEYKKLY